MKGFAVRVSKTGDKAFYYVYRAGNSGHSLPQIGALLGHNQTATTARYAHVAENPVHAVAEDAGAKIAQTMVAPPKKKATVTRLLNIACQKLTSAL